MGGWEAAFRFSRTFRSFHSRAGWRCNLGLNNPAPTKSGPASGLKEGIAPRENRVNTFGSNPIRIGAGAVAPDRQPRAQADDLHLPGRPALFIGQDGAFGLQSLSRQKLSTMLIPDDDTSACAVDPAPVKWPGQEGTYHRRSSPDCGQLRLRRLIAWPTVNEDDDA
jgi:hypothetical protein